MDDIRNWLVGLGLEKYVELFDENEIDLEAAKYLTEDVLEKLDIPIGPRLKLVAAIAELNGGPSHVRTSGAPAVNTTPSPPREAERRQITVMFCDLVGSTALSKQLDPEDLRALMQAYQQACGAVIERYDGHVAQYLGDGLMVYFGWPHAHEDDAQRAVRAGLDIVQAVKTVEGPDPLQVRVGIATGPVVVGETGAGDAAIPKAAVGETPNLAARVQGLAEADQIVIAPSTRRLTGGAFDYKDLGEQALKGVAEPMKLWRVLGESEAEGRFEAQTVGGLTPFVGRDVEVAMLLDRWEHAKGGEGQVVLLEGEPGIGKSRITQELRSRLMDEPHTRLSYQCSPYHKNSAFYPITTQLERAAGLDREDESETKLDKLEAVLVSGIDEGAASAPLLAAMLSLPIDRYPPLNLSPQRQKDRTIEALVGQFIGLAVSQPVLMIFEDAHWSDPTTLEVLNDIIARIEQVPALLVITHRPEFEPPWPAGGHVTAYTLTRLPRRLSADLVASVSSGKRLPDSVLAQIVAKTDGVPLYVEELTKTILEAGYLRDAGDRYELDGPLPPLAIPSTLQDSLMARLDRLGPIKEVAQIGACIGREFSLELLSAISPMRDRELEDAIQELISNELITGHGAASAAAYSFKHALVQDAAYGGLLKSRRQEFHQKIASELANQTDAAAKQPETIALHYSKAGRDEEAHPYWLSAARLAMARSSLQEAEAHLRIGLETLDAVSDPLLRAAVEMEFQSALGTVLSYSRGYASPEVEQAFDRALALAREVPRSKRVLPIYWGVWVVEHLRGKARRALEIAEEMVALASDDREEQLVAHTCRMDSLVFAGRFSESKDEMAIALRSYDAKKDRAHMLTYGFDMKLVNLFYAPWWAWPLGYPDQGLAYYNQLQEHASSLNTAFMTAFASIPGSWILLLTGHLDKHRESLERGQQVARDAGLPWFLAQANQFLGLNAGARGDLTTGIELLSNGNAMLEATGGGALLSYHRTCLAEMLAETGGIEEAERTLDMVAEQIENGGETLAASNFYRAKGDIALKKTRPDSATAADCFKSAIDVAHNQNAKSWELRATTSLGKLWHSQGKTREAYGLVAPVYDWFTEGFDTADLRDAKALLDVLK